MWRVKWCSEELDRVGMLDRIDEGTWSYQPLPGGLLNNHQLPVTQYKSLGGEGQCRKSEQKEISAVLKE